MTIDKAAGLASQWVVVDDRRADPFERLFLDRYEQVVRIANSVVRDEQEAEDVAQEVFYDFHRRHDPTAPYAGAWLHRAATHLALNRIRGARRRQRHESAEAAGRARLDDDSQNRLDPQIVIEASERHRQVRDVLARLPKKQSTVLVLRHSGLSYAEIAAGLGVRIGQVGTLLHRAEEAFKKEMVDESH